MSRFLIAVGALAGLLAVALSAYAAHGLSLDPARTRLIDNALTQQGVARIAGLDAVVAHLARETFTIAGRQETVLVFDQNDVQRDANGNAVTMFDGAHDVLLGGGGSDTLQGKDGNDILDGDRWLNVRIRITAQGAENTAANQIATVDSLKHVFTTADGQAIGLDPHGHRFGQSGPVAYWHVDDVAKSLATLVQAGAETVQEPTDVGGGMRIAVAKDADGNLIGLRPAG